MKRKEAPAPSPFVFKDCALITRMGGVRPALNLRELQERVAICPPDCLFHHFCEVKLRPTFDDPVYHNDFAVWADRHLLDPVLAERLGVLDPYETGSLENLRARLIEIIDQRLGEVEMIPWARRGGEFHFMRGVATVFDTGLVAPTLSAFGSAVPRLPTGSIYYHFIEARRRTQSGGDDFTVWLRTLADPPGEIIRRLEWIDFHSFTLSALKQRIADALAPPRRGGRRGA